VDTFVSMLGWLLIDVLLVSIGRMAVFVLSLGRWRGERVGGNEASLIAPSGALSFVHQGRRVFTRTGLLFAGMLFSILMLVLALGISQW
jgi:hypothetical protein